jgi:aminoglycoside phosphotransferase family enzyme/predicted kinase
MINKFPEGLIQFLEQTASYPHQPESVEHIQTHISHVFIAPPYVYKFKKPVNFDFLDFSTLKKRKYYCEREVDLNSRLCEGPYIGVVPLYKSGATWSFNKTEGAEPAEYGVHMHQLSGDHFLIEYMNTGKLTDLHLRRVADKLLPFYKNQSPGQEILKWGEPDRIKINTDENFEQTKEFIGNTISRYTYETMQYYTNQFLNEHRNLFKKRIEEKRIKDGHGDLHLEHIHFSDKDGRVCIYDCIEFNDRFRYQDIASDLAFLAMDLDFNGLPDLSRSFIEQMSEGLNDPDLMKVVDFYRCYRAYVRGKVKSLESSEEEVGTSGRERAVQLAKDYFSLALQYVLFGSKPSVLVFMGRVASGKSTLAKQVADELNIQRYSSDILRKEQADQPLKIRTLSQKREKLYRKEVSDSIYRDLADLAVHEISEGRSIVLDATFGNPEYRKNLISQIENKHAGLYFIEAEAPQETRLNRLQSRENQADVISDARAEDLDKIDRFYHSPGELPPGKHITVSTNVSVGQSLKVLFRGLTNKQIKGIKTE